MIMGEKYVLTARSLIVFAAAVAVSATGQTAVMMTWLFTRS